MVEEATPERPPYPEVHLCPHCLTDNLPTFNFCHDCGAPLGTVPFQSVWAKGWIYRNAIQRPTAIHVVGMSIIFLPSLIFGCLTLFSIDPESHYQLVPNVPLQYAISVCLVVVSAAMILLTTKNYLSVRSGALRDKNPPDPTE